MFNDRLHFRISFPTLSVVRPSCVTLWPAPTTEVWSWRRASSDGCGRIAKRLRRDRSRTTCRAWTDRPRDEVEWKAQMAKYHQDRQGFALWILEQESYCQSRERSDPMNQRRPMVLVVLGVYSKPTLHPSCCCSSSSSSSSSSRWLLLLLLLLLLLFIFFHLGRTTWLPLVVYHLLKPTSFSQAVSIVLHRLFRVFLCNILRVNRMVSPCSFRRVPPNDEKETLIAKKRF